MANQARPPKAPSRLPGTNRSQRALPIAIASRGLFVRRVDVRPPDVVYVKGILEASEGLAVIFAERGGELVIASAPDRAAALDELLADLVSEIGARIDADQGLGAQSAEGDSKPQMFNQGLGAQSAEGDSKPQMFNQGIPE